MTAVKVSRDGQLKLPGRVRKVLHLRKGGKVRFCIRDNGVVELQSSEPDLLSLCGILKPKRRGVTLGDMEEAIADEATRQ